jgi:pSer/pThr/pTyr-binding forkhead associated (FHA) protein
MAQEAVAMAGGPEPDGTRVDAAALLRRAAAGGAALAGPHLLIREPRADLRVVALSHGCTVGRGEAVALRLDDPTASRFHLRLQVDEGGTSAEDLGSRNGLRINGRRARGLRPLRSGDRLEVGETVLRYVDPLEAPRRAGPRPSPAPWHLPVAIRLAVMAGLLALAALLAALEQRS